MSLASAQLEDLIGDSIGGTSILSAGGINSEYTALSGGNPTAANFDLGNIADGLSSGYMYIALGTDLTKASGATTGQTGGRWTGLDEMSKSSGGYLRAYGDSVTPKTSSAAGNISWASTAAGTFQNTNAISFDVSSGAWQDASGDTGIIWAVIGYDDTSSSDNYGASSFTGTRDIPLIACRIKNAAGVNTSISVAASGTTVTFSAGELKFTIA